MLTRRALAMGMPIAALPVFAACANAQAQNAQYGAPNQTNAQQDTYTQDEIVREASAFFGGAAESVAAAVERIFQDNGRPVGYIQGEEGSGAWLVGLRYGSGVLFLKNGERASVYWQGPSLGWDFGGNASKVFTLVYGMRTAGQIYRRYPGVEGSAYLIGGLGVNYQRTGDITLAPIRAGVGLRAGANVGYLSYSPQRRYLPL